MKRTHRFTRTSTVLVDRAKWGPLIEAWKHPSGAILIHHKPRDREHPAYKRSGIYLLVSREGQLLCRRCYYGPRPKPPLTWAETYLKTKESQ